ncbi:MAG: formylglycine-generating enzyme family protein [Succinatimonas sp.]|nr:formylglycine-generating enzyme family protein [Succinatimonas sp.]
MKILLYIVLFGFTCEALASAPSEDPHPQKDDVILPLPCNDIMVFRKIRTASAQQRLKDAKFTSGIRSSESPFAQDPYLSFVQGGFKDQEGYYYLMGKYEVSALQHQEIQGKCPAGKISLKDKLPAVSLSWFDAMQSAREYSLFLQQDAEISRKFSRQIFARLPSDAQWEYAARGGLNVSRLEFEGKLPPMEGDLAEYAWYQGVQSAAGHLNLPGRLKPNPLGLYDMLGNVQEMIFEPFHAVRTGRLHGQSGGFCVRGGSYLTNKDSVTSALRTEKPYFLKGHELQSKDTGYRLVIDTLVAKDSAEVKELNTELTSLGTADTTGKAGGVSKDTVARLDKIIKEQQNSAKKLSDEKNSLEKVNSTLSKSNQELSLQLQQLRDEMVAANSERDEMRDVAVVANLRLGGFLCRSMSDELSTKLYFEKTAKVLKDRCDKNDAMCPAYQAASKSAKNSQQALQMLSSYYGDTLAEAAATYDLKLFDKSLRDARQQLEHSGVFAFIEKYVSHLKNYAKRPPDPEKNREFWSGECHVGNK